MNGPESIAVAILKYLYLTAFAAGTDLRRLPHAAILSISELPDRDAVGRLARPGRPVTYNALRVLAGMLLALKRILDGAFDAEVRGDPIPPADPADLAALAEMPADIQALVARPHPPTNPGRGRTCDFVPLVRTLAVDIVAQAGGHATWDRIGQFREVIDEKIGNHDRAGLSAVLARTYRVPRGRLRRALQLLTLRLLF